MDARLEPYRVVVSFLGEALGPDYEVVLHDLTSEDGTIVAIVNNHISGRTEGAPLSNMALPVTSAMALCTASGRELTKFSTPMPVEEGSGCAPFQHGAALHSGADV